MLSWRRILSNSVAMYIESVPNRNSPPAVLLRESFRDAGKVRKRTLANLSKWPPTLIEGLRVLLKGGGRGAPARGGVRHRAIQTPRPCRRRARHAAQAAAWIPPSPARTRPSADGCWR